MSTKTMIGRLAFCAALAMVAANPAHASDRKTTNTIIGAGIGAAAGAVLTQGDTLATLGGAAAGGLLGNILTEEPRKRRPAAHGPSRNHYYTDHRHKPRHAHKARHGKPKWQHRHVRAEAHRGKSRHHAHHRR